MIYKMPLFFSKLLLVQKWTIFGSPKVHLYDVCREVRLGVEYLGNYEFLKFCMSPSPWNHKKDISDRGEILIISKFEKSFLLFLSNFELHLNLTRLYVLWNFYLDSISKNKISRLVLTSALASQIKRDCTSYDFLGVVDHADYESDICFFIRP
jgi:hypothetical protein